jgi:NADPH-dependent curcumin reductase CurA
MMSMTLGEVVGVATRRYWSRVTSSRCTAERRISQWSAVSLYACCPTVSWATARPTALSTALGVAGIPGFTAYAALTVHPKSNPGKTFFVCSASGYVGATAGQLARRMGLRTVCIGGAAEKVASTISDAGFDACLSYKSPDFMAELAAVGLDGDTSIWSMSMARSRLSS